MKVFSKIFLSFSKNSKFPTSLIFAAARLKWVWHFQDIYTILQQKSSSQIPKIEVEKYEDDSIRKDAMKEIGDLEQFCFLEQEKDKILEHKPSCFCQCFEPKKGSIATWYWHWKLNVLSHVQDQTDNQTGFPDFGELLQ